jgi:hypothetical protein
MRLPPSLTLAFLLAVASAASAAPVEVRLTSQEREPLPVVVSKAASPRVRAAAETLAEYLSRISRTEVRTIEGDGSKGIALGLASDFSQRPQAPWPADDPSRREDYLLRSHENGVWAIGATELAVEHAVWDLLYRLGHRQFFPGETWEVVPRQADLSIAVDVHESPDYQARRIWYGFGPWDYAEEPYGAWNARNRCTSGIELHTGHAYDGIIDRNRKAFDAHPEYLGLVGGERKSSKLCISNPDLRRLVVEDALAQFQKDPGRDSISVDPSDGPGWCECESCRAMGSVSDRAVTLLNEVAKAVNADKPGRLVGMYAYSAHSPPPTIRVHPQAVVSVATAFIRGGYEVDELMAGWNSRGATLGLREYLSVNTWDRDLPGKSRGSNFDYVAETIPRFHERGARFYSAESSDNWGPNGLGYYLAARMLWNVEEAQNRDALVADFLSKAFGDAERPMAEFYRLIDGSNQPLVSDHLIGRMYRLLKEAYAATSDPAVHRRLDDLALYTRYVELWFDYDHAKGPDRQAAFEAMIRHVYRMRKTMMVHAKALYRDVVRRDKLVSIPKEAEWSVPEGKNPWKSSEPFSRDELDSLFASGIERRRERGFEPAAFGEDLVSVPKSAVEDVPLGSVGLYSRGERTYWTRVADPAVPVRLTVAAGRVYQDRGDATVSLLPADAEGQEPIATSAIPPDGETHAVSLSAPQPGLYRVVVRDGGAGTVTEWPEGQPMTVRSDLDQRADFHGRWTLYFFVPAGTEFVGGYADGEGELRDADGKTAQRFEGEPGYFRIEVEPSQAGRLWKFERCTGSRLLMTVPPYLARSPEELLLPKEIVAGLAK